MLNEHYIELIEDSIDNKIADERKNDPTFTFDEVLTEFGLTYADLQD